MGSIYRYCLDMGSRDKVQTTTAHLQAVPHLNSPCPVCISYLQPISSLYPIFTAHVQRVLNLYSTNTDSTLSLHPLYCTCPVSSSSHLSMSSQYTNSPANIQSLHVYTISTAHAQSEHHVSNTCPTPTGVVQSVHHITCLCPVCRLFTLLLYNEYNNPPANMQTVCYLSPPPPSNQ